jgi:hypothetical protein
VYLFCIPLFVSMRLAAQQHLIAHHLSSVKKENIFLHSSKSQTIDSFINDFSVQALLQKQVRPFITDDARVVGKKLAQIEGWLRVDKESVQQWAMIAYGPNKKLEISMGGVFGFEHEQGKKTSFSYGLPLLQAKWLIREYENGKGPGFGLVAGSFLPMGVGSFKPPGFGSFAFATATQCIGKQENFLFHINSGINYLHIDGSNDLVNTWGIGTQIKIHKGMHWVGEVFSGDPYVPGAGTSFQTGYRYFFSDLFQIDMTVGKGFAGNNPLPLWFSAGVRIVSERYLKKKN